MKTPSRTARPFSFGPLYDFLFESFPEHRTSQGVFDVERLAGDMKVSKEAVYRFLRKNRLNPEQTDKLVRLLHPDHVPGLDLVDDVNLYMPFMRFVFTDLTPPEIKPAAAA